MDVVFFAVLQSDGTCSSVALETNTAAEVAPDIKTSK
jgi:hypothetical protein